MKKIQPLICLTSKVRKKEKLKLGPLIEKPNEEVEIRPLVQKSVEAEGSMGESANLSDTPKHISAEATSRPTGTIEIDTMILTETLLKYLGLKKEKKNKEKLKWFGTLIDLRDFVTLILDKKKENGTPEPKLNTKFMFLSRKKESLV